MIDNHDPLTRASAIDRLGASGPFEPDADELMLYGQLVGAWDIDWTKFGAGGNVLDRRHGEWHFAWILGGRGIQDVIWTVGAPPERDGTTVRCWDADHGVWRVVFMSPGDHQFVTLVGQREGDRIVQDITDRPPDAPAARWTFSEITDATFLWQAATSHDDGCTWATTHEMRARRRRA